MELGLIYLRHVREHPAFTADDAKKNVGTCGLPAFWFHDVSELLHIVWQNLPALSSSQSLVRENRGRLTMALEALYDLSQLRNTGLGHDLADVVQDIPQASRFAVDVDFCRDFALSGGYVVLLRVLQCATNPVCRKEVRLAAFILARVALGLAVIPWQPWRDQRDADADIFLDSEVAGKLVEELVHIVARCAGNRVTGTNTDDEQEEDSEEEEEDEGEKDDEWEEEDELEEADEWEEEDEGDEEDEGEEEGKLCLQETALSAICSFAHAASEMQAHRGWLQKEPGVPSSRFCNAFTTLGPGDWPLETPTPKFDREEVQNFIDTIRDVLTCSRTQTLLLEFLRVGQRKPSSRRLVKDSIRIFAYLLIPRMVYWHRFGETLQDFPPPLWSMDSLPDLSKVMAALKRTATAAGLSPFSKLHLAKIFIYLNIQGSVHEDFVRLCDCLEYCSEVRGRREIDWFTREVLDTVRDWFKATRSTLDKREMYLLIFERNTKESCFFFPCIIGPDFLPRYEITAIYEYDTAISKYDLAARIEDENEGVLARNLRDQSLFQQCTASVIGLAGDFMEELLNDYSLTSDGVFLEDAHDPLEGCRQSLPKVIDKAIRRCSDLLRQSLRVESVRPKDSSLMRYWGIFHEWIIEPCGNPAWRPACTIRESIHNRYSECDTEGMEGLEDAVHSLLLLRNISRLLRLSIAYFGGDDMSRLGQWTYVVPTLVTILAYRPGSFNPPTQLGFTHDLSARCMSDIRCNSAVVIETTLQAAMMKSICQETDPDENERNNLGTLWSVLRKWRQKSEQEGGPGSSPDFVSLVHVIDLHSGSFPDRPQADLGHWLDSYQFEVMPDEANSATVPKLRLTSRRRDFPRAVYCYRKPG
ncbi:hypothetical protein CBR_g680 [Chara braunii]|uniref:Uncharacterized protein n=1 Tax=Chara braunii TaxID=69332 RepID=A0A388KBY7_CHABU|nr:hypothetical protein CBR_g680 [Chara braunii]|eukprot:GBG67549.1 hypothetical protein CBR_g680 [Chara braunii]